MVTITVDVKSFTRNLTDVATNQIPFAVALTLSRCADEAVAETKAQLPSRFIVRRSWISKGFRVKYAKKNDLVAEISHLDPFMTLQEFGGEKDPLNAKSVAIPVGARPTPQSLTPQTKWPGRIGRRFFVTKDGKTYEFARVGRKTRGKRRKPHTAAAGGRDPNIRLMYVFKPSVPIKAKLGLVDITKKTIDSQFGVNFDGFLQYAVKTAK